MIRKNILSISFFFAFVVVGFAQMEEVSVSNLSSINSSKMDFGAVSYGDGLMFTSTNGEAFDGKVDKCNTNDYFSKLYYAPRDNMSVMAEGATPTDGTGDDQAAVDGSLCGFKSPQLIGGDLAGKFHDGTPTFSPDGNQMIFARNYPGKSNFMNACNDGRNNLRLMSADKVGDQWTNLKELPINNKEFNTAHPAFTPDGECLYFSSDRPGGVGGMDLYKICRSGEGWTTPTNLGAPVNTEGNELFPYVANNGILYYSTNGMAGGMGGLDIHSTVMNNSTWSTPLNLAAPFNSAGDDLGFSVSPDGQSGYLTSNRSGGQGGDDIYCWKVNKAPVNLAVADAASTERICNALVKIKELTPTRSFGSAPRASAEANYSTNDNCLALPDITHRRCYNLEVDHPGYEYWNKEVCAMDLATANPYVIPLVKRSFPIAGKVIYEDKSVVASPLVKLKNLTTGEIIEIPTDANGNFSISVSCLDDYELVGEKNGKSANTSLASTKINCDSNNELITIILPKPPPPPAPTCACTGNVNDNFNLPTVPMEAQGVRRLGSRPQFGNSHNMSGTDFYNKLKKQYNASTRDAKFLDETFRGMGYAGFNDPAVNEYIFSETILTPGIRGNMGYSRNRVKYVQLNTSGRDLEAFRVNANSKALNACHVHFMKTCGNFFFFCTN